MAEQQFLRLQIGNTEYYLPSGTSVAIEKREALTEDTTRSMVAAWREAGGARWPAYCVDEELIPSLRTDWHRAVFVQAQPHPIGLIGDEIQLVMLDTLKVSSFTPLGPPATASGHLFGAAYVNEGKVAMVLQPGALAAYLMAMGGT